MTTGVDQNLDNPKNKSFISESPSKILNDKLNDYYSQISTS